MLILLYIIFVKIPDVEKTIEKRKIFPEMKEGFKSLKKNKLLIKSLPHYVFVGFLYFPLSSLLPLLILEYYGGDAFHLAIINTSFAFGMLTMSLLIGVITGKNKKLTKFTIFSSSLLVIGVASIAVGLLPASLFWLCVVFSAFIGVGAAMFSVPYIAYIQESTSPAEMGRVFSLIIMMCTIVNSTGLAIAGPVTDAIGIEFWFIMAGSLFIINGIICYLRTKNPEKIFIDKQKSESKQAAEIEYINEP